MDITRKNRALADLVDALAPGMTVYNVSYHDRTHRKVKFFSVATDGRPVSQTHNIALALGARRNDEGFIVTNDVFTVVYALGAALFPGGFRCTGETCPSNEHTNGDRDYSPHHHQDGGYAFRSYDL
jgi:hypothetical protein